MPDFKARPTIYKGIQMRSRLEAGFAAWLDASTVFQWEYEPCAFASPAGQYLPDFRLDNVAHHGGTRRAYIEVKPPPFFGEAGKYDEAVIEAQEGLWRQMGCIWESEPDALLAVCGPGHLDLLYADPNVGQPWVLEGCQWTVGIRGVDGIAINALGPLLPWDGEWWKPKAP